MKLVVHYHENWLPTMAHEALPSDLSTAIICGDHHLARDTRVGWGAHTVRQSQAVSAKRLTYSVVTICTSLFIQQYSTSLSISAISWCSHILWQIKGMLQWRVCAWWYKCNRKHTRGIFLEHPPQPPELETCFLAIAALQRQKENKPIFLKFLWSNGFKRPNICPGAPHLLLFPLAFQPLPASKVQTIN